MSAPAFAPGDEVRLSFPGPMCGSLATLDARVTPSRWRFFVKGGMWDGQPFTAAEAFMEHTNKESENASV